MPNYDGDFEKTRLSMLAEQHRDIVDSKGEVIFCADDENRLSGTSWTIAGEVFDQVSGSGFKI